jgi:hypothetical protein
MFVWIQLKKQKESTVIGDVAELFLNPIGKVIKLAKGPKYANNKAKQDVVQILWS